MKSTASKLHSGAKDKLVVMNTATRTFGFPLLSCGARPMDQMSDVLSHSEDEEEEGEEEEDDDSRSQYEKPNRENSLMEDDEEDDDENGSVMKETSNQSTGKPNEPRQFHPALMTAVLAEGQEAMWVEDEVSTVASVFVKPQVPVDNTKKKSRFRRSLNLPSIKIPEDDEINPEGAQKIHVRKKKVKKTVLLLPQQEDEGAKMLVEANVKQEAMINMVKARQFLNQALLAEGDPSPEASEKLAKVAFAHATAARRLMSKPEDEPDLEDVLSILAEKGEHAAIQHQKIVFSQSFSSKSIEEPKQKKKGMFSSATEYANKALHYLESILPKNIDKEIQPALSDAADTISTLGFKTDTFEYQMRPAPSQPTRSYTNMDLMSISSLNEILDGPLDDTNENKPPSPRQVLPVINVPNKTPKARPAGPKEPPSFVEQLKKMVSPTSLTAAKPEKMDEHPHTLDKDKEKAAKVPPKIHQQAIMQPTKDEMIMVPPTSQEVSKQLEDKQPTSNSEQQEEDPPLKHKKTWGIMRKIRRGKHEKPIIEAPKVEVTKEGDNSSSSTESENLDPAKSSDVIDTIPTGPSKSFESEDQNSKISRYHIDKDNKSIQSNDSQSSASGSKISSSEPVQQVKKNESIDSARRLDTAKSDWDQSASFQRSKVRAKPIIEEVHIMAPSHAALNPPTSKGHDVETESDWDKSLDPCKLRMQTKSIANLSGEESSVGETVPEGVQKTEDSKTPARTPLSVVTGRTNDMTSVQGNTGVETVMEADQESVRVLSVAETSVHTREEDPTMSTATEVLSKTTKDETRDVTAMEQEPEPPTPTIKCETSTHAGNDSLIDFVISPRRANIITPGGRRPFNGDRGDEPSNIIVPILQPVVEEGLVDHGSQDTPEAVSEVPSTDDPHHHPTSQKTQPKLMKRITRIFGARKFKGPNKPDSHDVEKHSFAEKNIVQAMSDGNMLPLEDNLNAENAISTVVSQEGGDSSVNSKGDNNMDDTPTVVLEKALSKAVTMAEEANLEVDTAPFSHRKSRRNPLMETRPVPHDLVDAIRLQAGLERNRQKDRARDITRDAPGTSMHVKTDVQEGPMRLDPPKEDVTGYRVLAPTPRRKKTTPKQSGDDKLEGEHPSRIEQGDEKNDQRRITELLYGPSMSSENFATRPRKVALKGMYIGDLIDDVVETIPPPSEENVPNTEECDVPAIDWKDTEHDVQTTNSSACDSNNEDIPDKENEDRLVSPKAAHNTPRRARPKGARKSMLFGIRNLISSGQ